MNASAAPAATVEHEPIDDVTAVELDAGSLESTAPEYLRDLRRELLESGVAPTGLVVEACFDEACSLSTQSEADRLRGLVRAASFLGAGRVRVLVDDVAEESIARPALSSIAERARREGLTVEVEGPIDALDG